MEKGLLEEFLVMTPNKLSTLIGCPAIRIRDYCRKHFRDHDYKYQKWILTPAQVAEICRWFYTDYQFRMRTP